MGERGDEQSQRLLKEVETAKSHSSIEDDEYRLRPSSRTSPWTISGFLLVILALLLPLLKYESHPFSSSNPPDVRELQLAIPLHPKEHTRRNRRTLSFDWNVTLGDSSPDGVKKIVYLVNGKHDKNERMGGQATM